MRHTKLISLLLALTMTLVGLFGTTALAAAPTKTVASTTATAPAKAATAAPTATPATNEATKPTGEKDSLGKKMVKILIFAAIVGVLAGIYGMTTMRYNAEKMNDMRTEARKTVKRKQEKKE